MAGAVVVEGESAGLVQATEMDDYFPSPLISNLYDEIERQDTTDLSWIRSKSEKSFAKVPVYNSRELERVKYPEIKPGKRFSVTTLLNWGRNTRFLITHNGAEVDTFASLRRKCVIVCCVFLPLRYEDDRSEAEIVQAIIAAASEPDCPFQVVIVPKLMPGFGPKHFQHFFQAFPSTCLAVPCHEFLTCDYVCCTLGLYSGSFAALIVDPNCKILQKHCNFFPEFGKEAFPFTDEHLDSLSHNTKLLRCRVDNLYFEEMRTIAREILPTPSDVTLHQLLLCKPTDRLTLATDTSVSEAVSTLNSRYVGLYLCYQGDFLKRLCQLHQKCTERKLQFDILFVQLDFLVTSSSFEDNIHRCLTKYNISSSCWLFPCSDIVRRRLWGLTDYSLADKLIVLPPAHLLLSGDLQGGELQGKGLILQYGVNAYPFTRASILDRSLQRLRQLTLPSLFHKSGTFVRSPNTSVDVSELLGKEVLIYIDTGSPSQDFLPYLLLSYRDIRRAYPHFVLLYVPPDSYKNLIGKNHLSEMRCLFSRSPAADVTPILFKEEEGNAARSTLVAVGKNGQILSRQAQSYLDKIDGSLFADHLRSEIVSNLINLGEHYHEI